MNGAFIFDASALIAFLNDEDGAGKVENILQSAQNNACRIYMNKLNLLEIYYGVYRDDGQDKAEDTLERVLGLPIAIVDTISDDVFKEAGRLKATYKISIADSIALAEAKTRNIEIVTADHHEFDTIEKVADVKIHWIR